jgi:hypothetical protein
MNFTAPPWRTNTRDCLLDLLRFIEEQIQQAKTDAADQLAAVDAASGVVPLIMRRLDESEHFKTTFMLAFDNQFDRIRWHDWWEQFAKVGPEDFSAQADNLLSSIGVVKPILESWPA